MIFRLNEKKLKIIYIALKVIIFLLLSALIAFSVHNYTIKRVFYPLKYKNEIIESSNAYSLNPLLIFAIIKTESNFDKNAKSSAGAMGLMQITENTAKYVASLKKIESYDINIPATNIDFGCFYIKYLMERFEDQNTALCAYNAGEGNVTLWLTNKEYSDDAITLKKIPFKETRDYIDKIKKNFAKYNNYYGYLLDK